mgnify:CR=1 FL=1
MKGCNPHIVASAFKELGRKLLALIEEKIGALGPKKRLRRHQREVLNL